MIAWVFLDLDNTLYDYTPCNNAGIEAVSKALDAHTPNGKDAYVQGRHAAKQTEAVGKYSRLLYIARALEQEQGRVDAALAIDLATTYWDAYFSFLQLRPGVLDFLKATGTINVCIVTNQAAELQYRKIAALGISDYIDLIVTGEEVTALKPNPAVFEEALKRAGCKPDEVLMIGDDETLDLAPARSLGIQVQLAATDEAWTHWQTWL